MPCATRCRPAGAVRAGQVRPRRAVREHAGERQQPDAHRDEGDELEQGESDETRREHDHARREESDAQGRGAPEAATAAGQAECADDDREERQAEAARDDVVHHRAHGDRHEADGAEVKSCRHDRAAQGPRRAATGVRRQRDGEEDAVGRQEEPREHHGRVERAARQVGERPELREVVMPPQRVLRGERGDDHACRQRENGQSADAVRDGVICEDRAGPRGAR